MLIKSECMEIKIGPECRSCVFTFQGAEAQRTIILIAAAAVLGACFLCQGPICEAVRVETATSSISRHDSNLNMCA